MGSITACSDEPPFALVDPSCTLPGEFLADGGVGRDGIASLQNPTMTTGTPVTLDNGYVLPGDRVMGFVVDGQPIAIPHNVLWTHEIVNLDLGSTQLAISYCPLTGSGMVFDRSSIGGDEFGVSGLLFQSNLIMFNRRTEESLWPQMMGAAACGPSAGTVLARYAAVEMTWSGWLDLHPDTQLPSAEHDPAGFWRSYPYGNYESVQSFSFPMPSSDNRRFQKERVLGIPDGSGIAFPLLEINQLGSFAALEAQADGRDIVVLWDRDRIAAMAFESSLGGQPISFGTDSNEIFDVATGSRWSVDGRAIEGTLVGSTLEPVASAYVAFWGAWVAFFPNTDLWEN